MKKEEVDGLFVMCTVSSNTLKNDPVQDDSE